MRVLMTTDTGGGVWTFTRELTGGLLQRGCSILLVSVGHHPSPEQQAWCDRIGSQWGRAFRFCALDTPLERTVENERAYSGAEPTLLRLARENRIDLLHSNHYCFGALPVGIPKVVTAHRDLYNWARYGRDEHALVMTAWLQRYARLARAGLAAAPFVTAPTHWMADWVTRAFALARRPLVIAHGRSVPALDDGPRQRRAVTAGAVWDEAKNLALLTEVESPMPMVIAGETEHEGIPAPDCLGKAKLLGRLASDDLLALLRRSAVYLCTSRYEPFGFAPLEAALCGCAVVANDIASLREVWQEDALYFTDAESLTELLRDLGRQPTLLQVAQQRARERARCFTAERMVSEYYRLYQAALRQREEPAGLAAASA